MKKIFLSLMIVCIAFCSCTHKNSVGDDVLSDNMVSVVVYDSCEYLIHGYGMAHKGNCKYCKARMEKMIEKEQDVFIEKFFAEYSKYNAIDAAYRTKEGLISAAECEAEILRTIAEER